MFQMKLLLTLLSVVATITKASPVPEDPFEAGFVACGAAVMVEDCIAEAKRTNHPKQLTKWGDKLAECCIGEQVLRCIESKIMGTPICANYSKYFIGLLQGEMAAKFIQMGCEFKLCH